MFLALHVLHRIKMKPLLAATKTDGQFMSTTVTMMDGNHAVLNAHGQCSILSFPYASCWWLRQCGLCHFVSDDASAVSALLCCTIVALRARRVPKVIRINSSAAKYVRIKEWLHWIMHVLVGTRGQVRTLRFSELTRLHFILKQCFHFFFMCQWFYYSRLQCFNTLICIFYFSPSRLAQLT